MKIDQQLFEEVRDLLEEVTINSREEILPESDLEEDLGLNLDEDLDRLLRKINRQFEIRLDADLVMEELADAGATVAELTKLIHDEHELG